ncbi:MAG: class I SAM-dependent methyltransferase [Deltaproteobacteria bacterium]|nr:class I SAM-dependent methyltransferase [Deltaproteobacteria bacterium]
MKLNWAERWVVNNPSRVIQQRFEIRWLKKWGLLHPGAKVLEIGCGRGIGAGLIHREFQPSLLQAMDLDMAMVRRAKEYMARRVNPEVSFFVGDVSRLPYRDASLDAVFGFGVLHHIPDWFGAFSEVVRVLKPAGLYFMEELYPGLYQNFLTKHFLLHPKENRFKSEDLKKALKQTNLSLLQAFELRRFWILGISRKDCR